MRFHSPTIKDAKLMAQSLNAQGVIILAFGPKRFAGASYGANRKKCRTMGSLLDKIMERIGSGELPVWDIEETGLGL